MSLKDFIMKPKELPYDYDHWKELPFPERAKKVCQAWALQGFGAPIFAYLFYVIKLALYIWIWTVFCSFSADLGTISTISSWWFKPEALGKLVVWTMLLEGIGFGGASGPLTARYMPPLGGITYYLRPGTIKVPFFTKIPVLGSDKRNIFDVLLYIAFLYFMVSAAIAPHITPDKILPIVILLPILGILDRQIYLAARADVWLPALFVFMFPQFIVGGLKIVWFAIWFWAAFSKLTPTFSSVVGVMLCNSPVFKINALKKLLFKNFPEDLRLSKGASYFSHFGTLVEFTLPILLMTGTLLHWSYDTMFYIMLGITAFHTFIFLNFPMAVPLEWNIVMVYGGWVLFIMNPEFSPFDVNQPIILSVFAVLFVALPILGNLFPKYISFLLSMRYYAGTWAYSIWLFKGDSKERKLDPNIKKTSPDLRKQLRFFYDEKTANSIVSRTIAFRLMHLPSRALHDLIPKAVNNPNDYYWVDGEFLTGEVVGWNFGEGHLHHEPLLDSVQKRCHFESEELRVIMVESPQLHNGRMHWRIYDAKDGLIEEGYSYIKDLKEKMPWPETEMSSMTSS